MAEHKIVFLERESIRGDFRRPDFPHDYTEYPLTKPEELAQRVRAASIVIVNKVQLRGELLATLPALKMVAIAATGMQHGLALPHAKSDAVDRLGF